MDDLHEFDDKFSAYPAIVVNHFIDLGETVNTSSLYSCYTPNKDQHPHKLNKLSGFPASFHSTFNESSLQMISEGQIRNHEHPYRTTKSVNIANLKFISGLQTSFQCDAKDEFMLPEDSNTLQSPAGVALRMIYEFTNIFD